MAEVQTAVFQTHMIWKLEKQLTNYRHPRSVTHLQYSVPSVSN